HTGGSNAGPDNPAGVKILIAKYTSNAPGFQNQYEHANHAPSRDQAGSYSSDSFGSVGARVTCVRRRARAGVVAKVMAIAIGRTSWPRPQWLILDLPLPGLRRPNQHERH